MYKYTYECIVRFTVLVWISCVGPAVCVSNANSVHFENFCLPAAQFRRDDTHRKHCADWYIPPTKEKKYKERNKKERRTKKTKTEKKTKPPFLLYSILSLVFFLYLSSFKAFVKWRRRHFSNEARARAVFHYAFFLSSLFYHLKNSHHWNSLKNANLLRPFGYLSPTS